MADFFVTLRDSNNAVSITVSCTQGLLSIVDSSDYDTNDQASHVRAFFTNYRKVTITNQSDVVFTLATIDADPTADAAIQSASTSADTFPFTLNNGDNVYDVELCSVPTFQLGQTYELSKGDHVFNVADKLLYKSLVDTNLGNAPESSPNEWGLVAASALSSKYCITERCGTICDLNDCIGTAVFDANCDGKFDLCNDEDFCRSKDHMRAWKLILLRLSILTKLGQGDFDSAETLISNSKIVCNC